MSPFSGSFPPRPLHSFPTRRSSDLVPPAPPLLCVPGPPPPLPALDCSPARLASPHVSTTSAVVILAPPPPPATSSRGSGRRPDASGDVRTSEAHPPPPAPSPPPLKA